MPDAPTRKCFAVRSLLPRCVRAGGASSCSVSVSSHVAAGHRSGAMLGRTPENHFKVRVPVLYKQAEIPANTTVPAIAVSVTYREHEKAENPGSTPVSATKPFKINSLKIGYKVCLCGPPVTDMARARFQNEIARAIYGGVLRFRAKMPANEVEPPQRKERPEQGSAIRAALDGTFHRRALLVGRDLPHF
jgi:hypothetical protein